MHGGVPMRNMQLLGKIRTERIIRVLSLFAVCLLLFGGFLSSWKKLCAAAFFRAENLLRFKINSAVSEILKEEKYQGEKFISIDKNSSGELTLIISDTALMNSLSSEILDSLYKSGFETKIKLGSLTDIKALKNRGPDLPLSLKLLSSSEVRPENSLIKSEGGGCIRFYLEVRADTEMIFAGKREFKSIKTDVIIAEAVVFNKLPAQNQK